jgi:ribonuclease P protein component
MKDAGADAPSDGKSFAFPHHMRVTRGPDIEHVRHKGKRVRTTSLDVRAIASFAVSVTAPVAAPVTAPANESDAHAVRVRHPRVAHARVGIVVPKYSHGSVERNLVKRRLRELVRVEALPVLPAVDVVIRALPRAYTRTFDELREETRKWTRQLVREGVPAASTVASTAASSPDSSRKMTEPSAPAES